MAATSSGISHQRSRTDHTLLWSGEELIVWGGLDTAEQASHNNGAVYTPETGSWRPMADTDLEPRTGHTSVTVDGRVLIWGGVTPGPSGQYARPARDGAIYDSARDAWEPIADAPQARELAHAAVLADHVVFAGGNGRNDAGTLLVYSLAVDAWKSVPFYERGTDGPFWIYGVVALEDEAVVLTGTDRDLFAGRFRVGDTQVGLQRLRGLELEEGRFNDVGLAVSDQGEVVLALRSGDVASMYALDEQGTAELVDEVDDGFFRPSVSTNANPHNAGRMGVVDGVGVVATNPGDVSVWEVGTGQARRIQASSLDGYCGLLVPAGENRMLGWGGAECNTEGIQLDIER